jgi:hypothetical protein
VRISRWREFPEALQLPAHRWHREVPWRSQGMRRAGKRRLSAGHFGPGRGDFPGRRASQGRGDSRAASVHQALMELGGRL